MSSNIPNLSPKARESLIALLDEVFAETVAEDYLPINTNVETSVDEYDENRERDAQALRDADEVIKALAEQGHGDYSKYRNQIADLWDGEYGLWNGNDDCTTDLEDPELKDLWLIQEDHYDQHMTKADGKPKWNDMICSAGDYIFFA